MANTIPLSNSQKTALIAAGVDKAVADQAFALLVSDISAPDSPGGGTSITQAEVEAAIRESQPITAHSIGAVTTAATGANWAALPSGTCIAFSLRNRSGTTIEIAIGGTGTALQILDFEDITLGCLANSNEWSVRRTDQSNTQVTVQFYRYTR